MPVVNLNFIKTRRNELGLSMQFVAEKLGFKNASTYSKYESGEYSIKADMLPGLARVFNCTIEAFFLN